MNNDRIYYSRDTEMHAMRDRTLLTLVFLTVGLGIGAVLALLFAPSSGKTTRHDLAESMEDGLNTGRETVEPMVKRLEEQFNELRKSIEERLKHA
ncbi:MAG: YtxH domain-containing protein [Anaerolineae bacterium]|nr:YtxH domain-containing protein [Anaerolineae bacterium]